MNQRGQRVDRNALDSALTSTSHNPTRGREACSSKRAKIPNKSRRESIRMVPRDGIPQCCKVEMVYIIDFKR